MTVCKRTPGTWLIVIATSMHGATSGITVRTNAPDCTNRGRITWRAGAAIVRYRSRSPFWYPPSERARRGLLSSEFRIDPEVVGLIGTEGKYL